MAFLVMHITCAPVSCNDYSELFYMLPGHKHNSVSWRYGCGPFHLLQHVHCQKQHKPMRRWLRQSQN